MYIYIYVDILIFIGVSGIHCEELAHMIIYAENSHNPPSTSCRAGKTSGVIQSESQSREPELPLILI